MIGIASKYYDLSSSIGYEFWTHNNTRPFGDSETDGWHYDKDDEEFEDLMITVMNTNNKNANTFH